MFFPWIKNTDTYRKMTLFVGIMDKRRKAESGWNTHLVYTIRLNVGKNGPHEMSVRSKK